MLRVGETTAIKFNVDVHGTSATPDVMVVLVANTHELGFPAINVGTNEWRAELKIPADTQPGTYPMRVDVTLNNRILSPLKRLISVEGSSAASSDANDTTPPPVNSADLSTEVPVTPPEEKWEDEGIAVEGKNAPTNSKKLKINILDIVAEADKFTMPVKGPLNKPAQKKIKIVTTTPITLKKGKVVYE